MKSECFCGRPVTHLCTGEGIRAVKCRLHAEDLARWSWEIKKLTKAEKVALEGAGDETGTD